jgi:hypothetical protein
MNPALYIAYFTGSGGSSVALYYIGDGKILGVDVGAMKYDGTYRIEADGSLEVTISYLIPKSALLVTGQSNSQEQRISSQYKLPAEFWNGQIVRIETPLGALNARFEKLKDIQ